MNILVTGATGFIGTQLVRGLLQEGHGVCCTLLPGEENPFVPEGVAGISIEVEELPVFVDFLRSQQVDGVLHLASMVLSDTHQAQQIPSLIAANITFGTLVLEASVQAGVKWYVNTGSYWQYYDSDKEYSPVNLYAATKQAFTIMARYYTEVYPLRFCTLMLFDTYGPGDPRPKIFSLWERIAATGETLAMSPGDQIIDMSYTEDIVRAYIMLAEHLQVSNAPLSNEFVVSAKHRYTLRELAKLYEEVRGVKLNIEWGARPYRHREVMVPFVGGILVPGWYPKVSLEEGIQKMAAAGMQKGANL